MVKITGKLWWENLLKEIKFGQFPADISFKFGKKLINLKLSYNMRI